MGLKFFTRLSLSLGGLFLMAMIAGEQAECVAQKANHAPVIRTITVKPQTVIRQDEWSDLMCIATDPDGDSLTYRWFCPEGDFQYRGYHTTRWYPPSREGAWYVTVFVSDGKEMARDSVKVSVDWNYPPFEPTKATPENGLDEQPLNVKLAWECRDPEADSLFYDVYFGAWNSLTIANRDQTEARFDPGPLERNTQYRWQVVVKDVHGNITYGPVWFFGTVR
jgi:hypothetical protein